MSEIYNENSSDLNIKDKAVMFHKEGKNCAQSVLLSLEKYTGLDSDLAVKISSGFGGGIKSGEVCGAISGAVMVLGLCGHEKYAKLIVEDFKNNYGSCLCRTLKGTYHVSCDELISHAAELVEGVIKNGNL